MFKQEEMKCPQCLEKMEHHFRQQGGVRTHEWWECHICKISVTVNSLIPTADPKPFLETLMNVLRRKSDV
jgi:ribosomal protein L37AE/L43A